MYFDWSINWFTKTNKQNQQQNIPQCKDNLILKHNLLSKSLITNNKYNSYWKWLTKITINRHSVMIRIFIFINQPVQAAREWPSWRPQVDRMENCTCNNIHSYQRTFNIIIHSNHRTFNINHRTLITTGNTFCVKTYPSHCCDLLSTGALWHFI